MFNYLLKNADFAGLLRFVSPRFFEVVSPSVLAQLLGQLKRNQGDSIAWEVLSSHLSADLSAASLSVHIKSSDLKSTPAAGTPRFTREQCEKILTLFFYQILSQEAWILDFRAQTFTVLEVEPSAERPIIWQPQPYYLKISAPFQAAVRSLYCGFYQSNDVLFRQALSDLGLAVAEESFRAHFGAGDLSQMKFELKRFQNTFADVFEVCGRNQVKLKSEFFALGIMLLGLYETLEISALALDVRACFHHALAQADSLVRVQPGGSS
jgi:hypothetical protein